MKKALRIIAMTTGIVSAVSAVILGCIYLEDMVGYVKKIKTKLLDSRKDDNLNEDDFEIE